MKKIVPKFFILFTLIAGCQNYIDSKDAIYQIINDLVNESSINANMVFSDINYTHDKSELFEDTAKVGYAAPPIYGVIYYEKVDFTALYEQGLINEKDVDYMYKQTKWQSEIKLNPSKISREVISNESFISQFQEYSIKRDKTNSEEILNSFSKTFIRFSNPIYTQKKDAALISIWLYNVNGLIVERTLLIKFQDNKWNVFKILYEKR